jgi:putative tricarboxylic transport membrane protein
LLLAFLLGSLLEQNVEQSLIIATGDYTAFLRSPISLGFLIMAAAAVLFPIFASVARGIGRRAAAQSVQQ